MTTAETELLNALKATSASYKRVAQAIEDMTNILEKTIKGQDRLIELTLKFLDGKTENPEKKTPNPQDHYIS